jgi:hypothetical protein
VPEGCRSIGFSLVGEFDGTRQTLAVEP